MSSAGSPASSRRREDHAADTRRAILAAARQAFAAKGYADTSLDEIVAAARLTKGALYHHFKNKAALLEAVYIAMEEEVVIRIGAAMADAGEDAWARTVVALETFFAASAEPDYVRIVLLDAPLVLGTQHGREIDESIGLGTVCALVTSLREAGLMPPLPITATARLLLGATSELAIAMGYAADRERARREGIQVVLAVLEGLRATAR